MATTLTNPPATPQPRWNTLQLLRGGRLLLLALDAVLLLAALGGISEHRHAMQTVGKDSAPSIIAAQHIKSALADMDANAANELLSAPAATSAAVEAYERRRIEAARALINAAENITYGDAERGAIERLQLGLGTYERLIQRARDLHERNDSAAIAAWREAAKLLDEKLLPAADALDKANDEVLEREYVTQSDRSATARVLVGFAGALLLGGLVFVQTFLSRRMKRTLNVFLLAATVLAAWTLIFTGTQMMGEQRQLKIAKEDAFTSSRALWRARAVASWANGDESRYLLDRDRAAQYEIAFFRKTTQLAGVPKGMAFDAVARAERGGIKVTGFTGYLADELNNITFPGEREAASDTLDGLGAYLTIDRHIRDLEAGGQHAAAVALCLGNAAGQSNWAFERFDAALAQTTAINQQAFETAVDRGFSALSGLELKTAAVAIAIAVLIFLGLAPRIREYQ